MLPGIRTILKTTDGGTTFNLCPTVTNNRLNSICFINSSTGFAVGEFYTILKTTDAGYHWSECCNEQFFHLQQIYFVNANVGYIAGDLGHLSRPWMGEPPGIFFLME